MSITEKRIKTLEDEVMSLRASLEKLMSPKYHTLHKVNKNRAKLLDLFGEWDGDIDSFLQELYERRERRGRIV
jgi:hypothetical protein